MNKESLSHVAYVVALIIIIVMAHAIVAAFLTATSEPATNNTSEYSDIDRPLTTKAGYIEVVRRNNPNEADFMACVYGAMIDDLGLEWVRKMDLEFNSMSEEEQVKVASPILLEYMGHCE